MRGRSTAVLAAITAVLLALVASGCGGSASSNASATATSGGASVTPASAPIFVSINTDVSSSQWQAADKLLDRFPGRAELMQRLHQAIRREANLDWETDIKPALGPELDLVVLDFQPGTNVVGLLQPGDDAKFAALIKKGNASDSDTSSDLVYEKVGDWTVVADSQAKIDLYKRRVSGDKLADDDTFAKASAVFPDEALAKAYLNGPRTIDALARSISESNGNAACFRRALRNSGASLEYAVADLAAEDDGVRVEAAFKSPATPTASAYHAALLNQVPAGALLFASFKGSAFSGHYFDSFQQGARCAGGSSSAQLDSALDVFKDVGKVLANENAFYVRPGAVIPEVTLVAQPDDPAAAVTTIDKIVSQVQTLLGLPLQTKPVQVAGVDAKAIDLGRFSILYGAKGGKVVVTDQQQAFADLGSSGPKLADDETFKEAVAAAGMPDQTDGFLYVNLKNAVPYVESFAQLAGETVPRDVSDNLRPLRTFLVWAADGQDSTSEQVTLFLEIQ